MREIRTLRAMWRALETALRQLLNGHEEGNLGYKLLEPFRNRANSAAESRSQQDRRRGRGRYSKSDSKVFCCKPARSPTQF